MGRRNSFPEKGTLRVCVNIDNEGNWIFKGSKVGMVDGKSE